MSASSTLRRLTRGASVHQKIRLLPLVAALALLVILLLTVGFGFANERRLSRIEREDYPAVRLTDSLQGLLVRTQRRLEDVRATRDTSLLPRTDALRDLLIATIAGADSSHVPDSHQLDQLRLTFLQAYALGRDAVVASSAADSAAAFRAAAAADEQFRLTRDQLAARAASQRQHVGRVARHRVHVVFHLTVGLRDDVRAHR